MRELGVNMSKGLCHHLLQCCIHSLETGETVFHLITNEGFESDSFLATHCIRMFARFGRLKEANHVFIGLSWPSVYAWSAIVFANAMLGQSAKALQLYSNMIRVGSRPDSHTFVAVLKACTNEHELTDGMLVHAHVIEWGLESMDYVGSGLIGLYVRCHRLHDARLVFDRQLKPNVVLWSALIHGYSQNEYYTNAIALFEKMQCKGVEPSQVTHVCVIKACASSRAITQGMWMHSLIIEASDELQTFVGSSLVDMYGRLGMLRDARKIFEKLQKQDVNEWNAMIVGEMQHACVQEVLQLHNQMQQHGVESNQSTLTCILKICADTNAFKLGKQFHAHIAGRGLEVDLFLTNALINLYARCGDIQTACNIFQMSDKRNAATWSCVIAGCAKHGHKELAFQLFEQINVEGGMPNTATLLCILSACSHIVDLKLMHSYVVEAGFELDAGVVSNLISRYGQCASLPESLRVFERQQEHDVASWNALINAYAQHGQSEEAFSLFHRMQRERTRPDYITYNTMISLSAREGLASEALQLFEQMQSRDIQPDAKVFSCILEVCSKLALPQVCKLIHGKIVESGLELDVHVGAALVRMYLSFGGMEDAEQVFDRVDHGDEGIWNAMISGYIQIGHSVDESSIMEQEATIMDDYKVKVLQVYCAMNQEGVTPGPATFVCMMKLCSMMGALDPGKQIYAHVVEAGLDQDLLIGNMLVHMYTEFSSSKDALYVFTNLGERNVVTFNTLFAAFAQESSLKPVLDRFHIMQQEGVKADNITVLSLFSACGHAGKHDEALFYFKTMRECFEIELTYTHYTCMVDLMGRMGYLTEGQDLLQTMPSRPNNIAFTSILRHCTTHGFLCSSKDGVGGSVQ